MSTIKIKRNFDITELETKTLDTLQEGELGYIGGDYNNLYIGTPDGDSALINPITALDLKNEDNQLKLYKQIRQGQEELLATVDTSVFWVTATDINMNDGTMSVDKTNAEIAEAYQQNYTIGLKWNLEGVDFSLPLIMSISNDGIDLACFANFMISPFGDDTAPLILLAIISGDQGSFTMAEIASAEAIQNHIEDTSNPHNVTKSQIGLGSVENKSSATIRGELTKSNVTTALGYTPLEEVDIVGGSNVTVTEEDGKITISASNTNSDYVSKSNNSIQTIAGGLVVGKDSTSGVAGTGKGRLILTGQTNPLIGLQATVDGKQLDPYYIQALSDGTMCLGPTAAKALSFDSDGNMSSPANLSMSGDISSEGDITADNGTISGKEVIATKFNNTATIGSATNPIYIKSDGVPDECTYELNATVPSDAKFTDTWKSATTSEAGTAIVYKAEDCSSYTSNYTVGGQAETVTPLAVNKAVHKLSLTGDVEGSFEANATSVWAMETEVKHADEASKVTNALTIGDNKTFDGSSAVTITAGDLGISSALKYKGKTTDVTKIKNPEAGDVYSIEDANGILTGQEKAYTGSEWIDLGDEKSYALKTIKIEGGDGLKGGGNLTENQIIKPNLKDFTKHSADSAALTNTSSRQYAVGLDKSGYLSVNVPWSDTNTKMYVYRQTSGYNNNYPLLVSRTAASSIGTAGTNGGKTAVYGVFREDENGNPTLLANPAAGSITATTFIGNVQGKADTAEALAGTQSASKVPLSSPTQGQIVYYYNVNTGLEGNMPNTSNNANGILTINTHSGNYYHQLGFNNKGEIYHRSADGSALTDESAWGLMLDENNYKDYALPLTGGEMQGPITINGGDAANASKIILDPSKKGQITDNGTSTILGFTASDQLTIGHASYKTQIRGANPIALQQNTQVNGNLAVTGTTNITGKLTASGDADITGNTTIGGTLTLSKTQDAAGKTNNSPALIVGGTATTAHIEMDNNEILAKSDGTNPTTLNLNTDGGAVVAGGAFTAASLKSTGGLTIGDSITYLNGSYTDKTIVQLWTGDNNACGIAIGGGGPVIIGGGESASSYKSNTALAAGSEEATYITADKSIYFFPNCDTIANRVGAIFDTSRNFYPIDKDKNKANNTGSLGLSDARWNTGYFNTLNTSGGITNSANGIANTGNITQTTGHIYLTGSSASNSTSNTTQIVMGTSDNQHVALSANNNCLVINPNTSTSSPQIALYLDDTATSKIPGSLNLGKAISIGTTASITGLITQGSPASDASINSMNRFQADLFVEGNGSAPNEPVKPGFYLGKSAQDENRHMDIVSGGDYSYIDFNKASVKEDYRVRLIANVTSGFTEMQWASGATNKKLSIDGALNVTGNATVTGTTSLSGQVTASGTVDIRGTAASQPLKVRGIVGSDGNGTVDALYLQYGANKPVYFGNSGGYTISADGSDYSGNSATATKFKDAADVTLTGDITGTISSQHGWTVATSYNGIVPLSKGGTGANLTRTANAIIRYSSSGNYFSSTPTASGAFYATSANGSPAFGTLPVAQGGTGATTAADARTNLGAVYKGGDTITGDLTVDGITQVGKLTSNQVSVSGGIRIHDLRNSTPSATMFGDSLVNFYFDDTGSNNIWQSIIHMRGWTGNYATWELAGNAHTNNTAVGTLRYRVGLGDAWSSWHNVLLSNGEGKVAQKLYFDSNSLSEDTTSATGLDFVVGIKAFASPGNGEMVWQHIGDLKVGSASTLTTSRNIFGKSFNGSADVAGQGLFYGTYTATAANRYAGGGLQIREQGLVAAAQSDIGYAPSIGFHWGGRVGSTLCLHSDGNFYFRKQDGVTRASVDANIIGTASNADQLDNIDSTGFVRYYNSSSAGLADANVVNTPTYLHTVSTSGGSITTISKPSGMDNAWGVLHVHTHSGNYATQLGFGGTTGKMYFRNAYNSTSFGDWKTLLDSSNYTDYKTYTQGLKVSGRYQNNNDDEGIVIGKADNGYAGLCLGEPGGVRSVMYLKPDNTAIWRYTSTGTSPQDIIHPNKSGTIALTSDLSSYLLKSGGTMTGALTFANGTMNPVGDDAAIGDQNIAGTLCVKGINGATSIRLLPYDGNSATVDIKSNNVSTYTPLQISGLKTDYHGVLIGANADGLNVMCSNGNTYQGLYNQSKSKWILIYNRDENNVGVGGRERTGYSLTLNEYCHLNSVGANSSGSPLSAIMTFRQKYTHGSTTVDTNTSITLNGSTGAISSSKMTASNFYATQPDAYRMVYGNYGVFWRNDGSNTYLLITNSGDQYGSWNGLRPFYVNNASGDVTMSQNVHFSAKQLYTHLQSDTGITAVPNARIQTDSGTYGRLRLTSNSNSSRLIKDNIENLSNEDIKAENLYNLPIYQFKYKKSWIQKEDCRYDITLPGFIIEEMDEIYPVAVDKNSDSSETWGWNTQYLLPPMLKLIQDQKKQLDKQQAEIDELKELVNKLLEKLS